MTKLIEVKDRYYGNKMTITINDIVSITESYGKTTIRVSNPIDIVRGSTLVIQNQIKDLL